jgi:hypothetical protein
MLGAMRGQVNESHGVGGKRYRGSTKETNKKRAGRIAALRFSQAIEGTGLLERKAPSLQELSTRSEAGSNQQVWRARQENTTQMAGDCLVHGVVI